MGDLDLARVDQKLSDLEADFKAGRGMPVRIALIEADIAAIKAELAQINEHLKNLVAVSHMGKGAWVAVLKIGGIGMALFGAAAWVYTTFAGKH